MKMWKTHIKTGNEHFRNEAFDLAEGAYEQACKRANKLFEHWMDAEEIVAATVISYHNLANSFQCQGRYNEALSSLTKVDQLICESLENVSDSSERYTALLSGRNKTYMELLRYKQVHLPELS